MAFDHEFGPQPPVVDTEASKGSALPCLVEECTKPVFGRDGTFCVDHDGWEAGECDACGEVKPSHDGDKDLGEHSRGMVHAASIDPPDESWICDDCVARVEEAEIDRAETAREQYYWDK